MSCAYNSNLVAKICCRSGISGSVARGVFYLGTALAVSSGTAALIYAGLKASGRKTDREVFAALGNIQTAASRGLVAIASNTPGDLREGLLTSAGEQLLEAMKQIKRLPTGNPLRMECAVQVERLAKAIVGAAEVLREPGDIARAERVQNIFKSGRYALLYPPQPDHAMGKALLLGGAAGITTLAALGLMERNQGQATQPTPSLGMTRPMRSESSSFAKTEEQGARTKGQPLKVAQVEWKRRKVLDGGGFAMVYEIAPGVVAKVGTIKPNEAWLQQYYAEKKRALPVFDYQPEVELPGPVSKECCPVHGPRKEILPEHGYACTCGKAQAVLLMPKAEQLPEELESEGAKAFRQGFAQECAREFDFYWDARPRNVARYQGQWVALDFGEEFEGLSRPPLGWQPPGMISGRNG